MSFPREIPVDPNRLEWRQGDIGNSYSADRIGEGKPIRPPFRYRGGLYVRTSGIYDDGKTIAEAMRLVLIEDFEGDPTTYAEKVRIDRGDFARADPLGFYHGMTVTSGGKAFVMVGPEVRFVPDDELAMPTEQMALFA